MTKYTIVKDGYPLIGSTLFITLLVYAMAGPVYAVIPFVLACYFMFFFRDRVQDMPQDPGLLYSPADATVVSVEDFYDKEFLNEPAVKVTMFLSIFNIHTNRIPMAGTIKYMRYTSGGYEPAYKESAPIRNERMAVGIDNGKNRILVIVIAGILARRIVSWISLDNNVRQGDRYGMIKFGSCAELVMPRNVEILVHKGDKVKGGITPIGRQSVQ